MTYYFTYNGYNLSNYPKITVSHYTKFFWYYLFYFLFFQGGNILDDEDLLEMGVLDQGHRQKILDSCHNLPALRPIGDKGPESVGEWLRSLHLDQYLDTFRRNGYDDMARARKLWEVELNSVSAKVLTIEFLNCHYSPILPTLVDIRKV